MTGLSVAPHPSVTPDLFRSPSRGSLRDMRERQPCVYIIASAFYVGVTSNFIGRITQHREGRYDGFTKRYAVHRPVWYEMADRMESAIASEKRIKNWPRDWKINLIEERNPSWGDLAIGLGLLAF